MDEKEIRNYKDLITELGTDYRLNKILLSDIPDNEKFLLLEAEKSYRLSQLHNIIVRIDEDY